MFRGRKRFYSMMGQEFEEPMGSLGQFAAKRKLTEKEREALRKRSRDSKEKQVAGLKKIPLGEHKLDNPLIAFSKSPRGSAIKGIVLFVTEFARRNNASLTDATVRADMLIKAGLIKDMRKYKKPSAKKTEALPPGAKRVSPFQWLKAEVGEMPANIRANIFLPYGNAELFERLYNENAKAAPSREMMQEIVYAMCAANRPKSLQKVLKRAKDIIEKHGLKIALRD